MNSMTGFGRGSQSASNWVVSVELASVNRKQLEIVANLPRELVELESRVRQTLTSLISRGRIQASIKLEKSETAAADQFRIETKLALSFENAFRDLSKTLGREVMPSAADFLRQPGLIEMGDSGSMEAEEAWKMILPALEQALTKLNEMRAQEGAHLKKDCIERLEQLMGFTKKIIAQAPLRPTKHKDVLLKRLSDLGIPLELDDERLLRELAIFADRCDISEEITRLHSHFEKFQQYLSAKEASGRALDFLCQELFREFNTIASKSNDAFIAQTVVEAKTELEKLREQIQNIE
jgi:uncharacterized protein (TIGR00255 family)